MLISTTWPFSHLFLLTILALLQFYLDSVYQWIKLFFRMRLCFSGNLGSGAALKFFYYLTTLLTVFGSAGCSLFLIDAYPFHPILGESQCGWSAASLKRAGVHSVRARVYQNGLSQLSGLGLPLAYFLSKSPWQSWWVGRTWCHIYSICCF